MVFTDFAPDLHRPSTSKRLLDNPDPASITRCALTIQIKTMSIQSNNGLSHISHPNLQHVYLRATLQQIDHLANEDVVMQVIHV